MSISRQAFILAGFLMVILVGGWGQIWAQGNSSPRLNAWVLGNEPLIVTVKDTTQFKKKYGTYIDVHKVYRQTRCVALTVRDIKTFYEMRTDQNVQFMDVNRKPHTEGGFDFVNPSVNKINMVRNAYPELRGAGHNISIKEESFDETDIDLKERSFSTSVTPLIKSQHATTMTVLIAGAGNSSPQAAGVADHARFTASDFSNLMPDAAGLFVGHDIFIQNHSYGVGIENYYGNEAVAYDQQIWDNPSLVHIFSSGNSGNVKPTDGVYRDLLFANLTGTFKQSKNVLVVTAIDTSLSVNDLNSRGPAYDGRIKPELTAYGPGGTSEAAAITTGVGTLIQENYQQRYNQLPDASLVKAILIASSDDIGPKGIDFLTGYGNINAYKAMTLISRGQIFQSSLISDDLVSFPINVTEPISQLKIAICWTDVPATVNSQHALVNDMDAWVEANATITRPWVLSSYPHPDSLKAAAKRGEDHVNNVEFITLDNPTVGTYLLTVKSKTLASSSQKISVAYWQNMHGVSWTFPVASDIVVGGVKNLLQWEAQSATADLYVQLSGGNWQLIQSNLDLKANYTWEAPNVLSKAKLKLVTAGGEFLSDEFIISPQLQLKTAFVCADSLGFSWNKVNNAKGYSVFSLGNQYLEQVQTTTDTLIVFKHVDKRYYAVAPLMVEGMGVKSASVDYSSQGVNCFIEFFSAVRTGVDKVDINLILSSFYNIDHVNILKMTNGIESVLKTISSHELVYSFSDETIEEGELIYQVQIVFKNSTLLLSDPVKLIIERSGRVIIWPNPITATDYLNVVSEGNARFVILNPVGEILYEKELTLFNEEIDIEFLSSGLYFYQLKNGDAVTDAGRIIKL